MKPTRIPEQGGHAGRAVHVQQRQRNHRAEARPTWGQPVVVDSKLGASGNQHLHDDAGDHKKMAFDPVADFALVAKVAEGPSFVFAVNPAVLATEMKSLVAYARKNAGKLNRATPGNGTPMRLAMELLKSNVGMDIVHVPYKQIAGAITDLMGQVQMMFAIVPSMRPHAQAGKVRLLAVTGQARGTFAPACRRSRSRAST